MTAAPRWRVVYEPGADQPWLVQAGVNAHWLDWRRFNVADDARRLVEFLRAEADNGRPRRP